MHIQRYCLEHSSQATASLFYLIYCVVIQMVILTVTWVMVFSCRPPESKLLNNNNNKNMIVSSSTAPPFGQVYTVQTDSPVWPVAAVSGSGPGAWRAGACSPWGTACPCPSSCRPGCWASCLGRWLAPASSCSSGCCGSAGMATPTRDPLRRDIRYLE